MSKDVEKNQNKVHLTIVTTDGNHVDEFNIHQKLQHVVDVTVRELNLALDPTQYELVKQGNPTPLILSNTIAESGLSDGDVLHYQMKNGGGGSI